MESGALNQNLAIGPLIIFYISASIKIEIYRKFADAILPLILLKPLPKH